MRLLPPFVFDLGLQLVHGRLGGAGVAFASLDGGALLFIQSAAPRCQFAGKGSVLSAERGQGPHLASKTLGPPTSTRNGSKHDFLRAKSDFGMSPVQLETTHYVRGNRVRIGIC